MIPTGVRLNKGGRPRREVDPKLILTLRDQSCLSWPKIARLTGLGQGTVVRAYHAAKLAPQHFQNPKVACCITPKSHVV